MKKINRIISIIFLFLVAFKTFAQIEKTKYSSIIAAFEKNYNTNNYEKIFSKFSTKMKTALPKDKLIPFFTNLKSEAGNIL